MLNSTRGASLVAQWRNSDGAGNPAGALFISGPFAEADIAGDTNTITNGTACNSGKCGTICTGSAGHPCC